VEPASRKLGVQLHMLSVATAEDFDGALGTIARERNDGVFILASALTARDHRVLLSELALKHRLPTMFATKENVVAGGLMSYAPNHIDLSRRAASYIDKIIKGARPADLPVEQASKYQLVINLRTAQALGLNISEAFLLGADELIE
jgi:putative tryptophan/tyrosine transport system substrate-binding protein